ncbi:hypothetical protein BC833DRAFT_132778 [Globomyces pollinis-pini]|nr:hypothetical protein BC833DRAFT_132778 [Globomyces pollinis-pini]
MFNPVANVDYIKSPKMNRNLKLDPQSFPDLLRFEDRLIQHMIRFNQSRKLWQYALGMWFLALVYLLYPCIFDSPENWQVVGAMVALTIGIVLLSTGLLQKHILASQRFSPKLSKTLRAFNLTFNETHRQLELSSNIPLEFRKNFELYRQHAELDFIK